MLRWWLFWPGSTAKPLDGGGWNAAFRYRFEIVDEAAIARAARLRLTWQQPLAAGFEALVEGEAVVELNDHLNSGANGRSACHGYPQAPVAAGKTTLSRSRRSGPDAPLKSADLPAIPADGVPAPP